MRKYLKLLLVSLTLCMILGGCASPKEKLESKAEENGYDIEFIDNKIFCIHEEDASYYYKRTLTGIKFVKCEIPVSEDNVTVLEGSVKIIITDHKWNKVQVVTDDDRVIIDENGKKRLCFSYVRFISNKNFDEDSLDPIGPLDGEHKAKKGYKAAMKYLTKEDLINYYTRSYEILENL